MIAGGENARPRERREAASWESRISFDRGRDAIVLDGLKTVQARIVSADFRISLTEAGSLPLIRCDRKAIVQGLADLLDNAVKYSGDSSDIEIELAARDGAMRIALRDHGIGIPGEEIPHICEQFFRASNASEQRGYGLGLYLVKTIMDAHGGRVEISSFLNHGREFSFILPV